MPTKKTKPKAEKITTTKNKTKRTTTATTKKAANKKSVSKTSKSKVSAVSSKKKTVSTTKESEKATLSKNKNVKSTTKAKKGTRKKVEKTIQILEYYDLPYRYNETVIKILAQTPKVLFVYWDISDSDRNNYITQYGEYFFNDTYPVLIIHNKTKNYTTEVAINDFANSWYLNIDDANCEYNIELGRRFKEYAKKNPELHIPENNFIYITNSNNLVMPNDHVLFEEIKPEIKYKNVKTGATSIKNISNILIENKLTNFYELYQNIYQVEKIDFFVDNLKNPGSGNPTSTFR